MEFSTYSWMGPGVLLVILTVGVINGAIWVVERIKQRRLDALAETPPEPHATPEAEARRVPPPRQTQ